jgi:hypothetical protein
MAIGGGGSGGVKAYESRVRKATPSFSRSSDGPRGGKGRTLSRGAIQTVMDASQYARDIGSPMQFSDLANQYKEYNVKYDRPAVFRENYGDQVNTVGTPLASTYYKDPVTGAERFFTAATPTFAQFGGDMMRGLFSGYNTYLPQSQSTIGPYGLPVGPEGSVPISSGGYIQRQQGFIPKYLGSGGALGLITGALKSVRDKLF